MADLGASFTLVRSGSLLEEIAKRAKETKPVLRQWGAYLRAGARSATEAGTGMAPWAKSTAEKYAHTYSGKITAQAKVRKSYAAKLDKVLRRKGNEDARRELRRVLSGDTSGKVAWNSTVNRLQRHLKKAQAAKAAGGKVALGKAKSEKHKLMGKAAGAFKVSLETFRVLVTNMIEYSGVLFGGGRVGHGAVLPDRSAALAISASAREALGKMVTDWLVKGKQ
jgi:hypothetical protein